MEFNWVLFFLIIRKFKKKSQEKKGFIAVNQKISKDFIIIIAFGSETQKFKNKSEI